MAFTKKISCTSASLTTVLSTRIGISEHEFSLPRPLLALPIPTNRPHFIELAVHSGRHHHQTKPINRKDLLKRMASLSQRTFSVHLSDTSSSSSRGARRVYVNADVLKQSKISAGEVLALIPVQTGPTSVRSSPQLRSKKLHEILLMSK